MRSSWIGAPQQFELNQACRVITEAYGYCLYQVGSSLTKRDFRDVDLRCILDDEEFDKKYPGIRSNHQMDARWSLDCSAISMWLSKRTGLPIDFQFQRMTEANEEFGRDEHGRNAIGIFLDPSK